MMAKPQLGFVRIDVVAQKFSEDLRLPEQVPFAKKVIGPFFGGEISQQRTRPEDKLGQYGKGEIVEGDGVRQDGPGNRIHLGSSWLTPVCAGFWMVFSKSFLPKRFKIGIHTAYMNALIVGA